jgi:glucan phosphorylase
LASDHIREAARQGFPLVAVGLFYQKAQSILSPEDDPPAEKLKILKDESGQDLTVTLPFEGRTVYVRAWVWQEMESADSARAYLLDTDFEKNDPRDRKITEELYNEDRDLRLKQEILLGIGGFRLLERLGHHPAVYHLNEGHSAFLALELVRHEMEHQRVGFSKAVEYAKRHVVFTNHTLVPAGQEQFSSAHVAELIEHCALEICLSNESIIKLGAVPENPENFSMTLMSFRLSDYSNSVSKLHLTKAREIWPEYKMENVTNGIFLPRWDKLGQVDQEKIWSQHLENKKSLFDLVKKQTQINWGETDLVLAWGRRMVSYKQPLLILDDLEKIERILKNSPVPVRIVFSGPTGKNDNPFIDQIKKTAEERFPGSMVFLPNYSTKVAKVLAAGADVWLNTPAVGNEACGTSGMKAALNGALNLSTNDGWVAEVEAEDIGWVVENSQNGNELREKLEKEIIPLYQEHLKSPENSAWAKKMERARETIARDFSATRMLREYIENLYIPAIQNKHERKID